MIVGWLEGSPKNGPAMRAHSTRSTAGEGSQSTELLWRTGEEGRHAPPKARLLMVVAVGLRIVSCAPLRPCSDFDLRTRICRLKLSDMRGMLNQGHGAWVQGKRRAGRSYHDKRRPSTSLLCPRASCSWRCRLPGLGKHSNMRRRCASPSARPTGQTTPMGSRVPRQRPPTWRYVSAS